MSVCSISTLVFLSWGQIRPRSEHINSEGNDTYRHTDARTNTELIISSLITLLILHLPADSAIYRVSLQKRRSGNETDVCKAAFWVICLIRALMGSEGIKRLKQHFSFSSFTYPSSFPSRPLLTKMSRS